MKNLFVKNKVRRSELFKEYQKSLSEFDNLKRRETILDTLKNIEIIRVEYAIEKNYAT